MKGEFMEWMWAWGMGRVGPEAGAAAVEKGQLQAERVFLKNAVWEGGRQMREGKGVDGTAPVGKGRGGGCKADPSREATPLIQCPAPDFITHGCRYC